MVLLREERNDAARYCGGNALGTASLSTVNARRAPMVLTDGSRQHRGVSSARVRMAVRKHENMTLAEEEALLARFAQ